MEGGPCSNYEAKPNAFQVLFRLDFDAEITVNQHDIRVVRQQHLAPTSRVSRMRGLFAGE